ncbi:aspartate-semialdehyde dehydrogenase [Methylobacterium sp. W2]|uniref:usg protein n=1 Tax=Methylobacterium sp. W2 TaxID=2598107 RepID=UPI001D0CA68B|nr:usg protein [Methylobacterium sp. W2]MCC0806098.1 aspartate-semialdehyde dehydrogenase [Methylobacterium sp. W2]
MAVSQEFRRQLEGYSLTTAEVLYHLPDHPHLLQVFVWQQHDIFPLFPHLKRFLAFWQETLDGPLHSVRVMHSRLIKPAELKTISGEFNLH